MQQPRPNVSNQIVKQWPEVFKNLYMDTMPLEYLETMTLEFSNGRIWKIDVMEQIEQQNRIDIADRILNTFDEYKDEIIKIDFRIDVEKLRNNTKDSTNNFL